MSGVNGSDGLAPRIRVMQILALALVLAPAIMLAVVLALRAGGRAPAPPRAPVLTYVALAFAAFTLIAFTVVPNRMVADARRRVARSLAAGATGEGAPAVNDEELRHSLGAIYLTRMIIGSSQLEGATFFQLISYFVEGQLLSLVVGAVLLAVLVGQFPTRARVEAWIDRQLERIKEQQWGN